MLNNGNLTYCKSESVSESDLVSKSALTITPDLVPTSAPATTAPTVKPAGMPVPANSPDVAEIEISDVVEVTLGDDFYTYNGKPRKPEVIVETETQYLEENTDYFVTYKNSTKVGTASVIITGTGKYTGETSRTFKILPKGTSAAKK